MTYPLSSEVVAGNEATATQYNNLRYDALIASAWVVQTLVSGYGTGDFTAVLTNTNTSTIIPGAKLQINQGESRNYVVLTSSDSGDDTIVSLAGDYSDPMTTDTIGEVFLSYGTPSDFPDWFNWTPTLTGFTSDGEPASAIYRFRIVGKSCEINFRQPNNGTSNATGFTISLPVAAKTITNMIWVGHAIAVDNGTQQTNPGMITVASAGTVLSIYKDWSGATWTGSGNKRASGTIRYEI